MTEPAGVLIRAMRPDDVVAAESITDEAFHGVDVAFGPRAWPEPSRRKPTHSARWIERTAALLASDPDGCWVAEVDGAVVGIAVAVKRDLTWILCSYAVRPAYQGRGIGRPLLDAAGRYADNCPRGMFASSADPRAVRHYLRAGFDLIPWVFIYGEPDRDAIPERPHVRAGTAGDRALLDSLDRRCREAAHGSDHDLLAAHASLVVIDQPRAKGYAYVPPGGGVWALAATDQPTATELLWEGVARTPLGDKTSVSHISPAQTWAMRVSAEAGLDVHTSGYLALRGMKEPRCYIPHGALL